jgi:hypothetical protein
MTKETDVELQKYKRAIEHASHQGREDRVALFGGLIHRLVIDELDVIVPEFDALVIKAISVDLTDDEEANLDFLGKQASAYGTWIERYSPDTSYYNELMSQARVNAWKRGDPTF